MRVGHPDAEGRDQRGAPRLGHQRRRPRTTSSARWWAPIRIPRMVRDFQSVIGREARAQMLERVRAAAAHGGRLRRRRLERDGHLHRLPRRRRRASWSASRPRARGSSAATTARRSARARPGVLHGSLSYLLQDADGQVAPAHSISAGLDYPGVGPEHSYLRDTGRVSYVSATDAEALDAFQAAEPARGDHPRARDRARLRLGAARGAGAGPRTRRCWSASAAAATRTWRTWRALLGSTRVTARPACRRTSSPRPRSPS